MNKRHKTLTSEEYLNIIRAMNHFRKYNIEIIADKTKIKFISGVVLFGVGVLSFPIPFITIPILLFSLSLMGLTIQDIVRKKRQTKAYIKYRIAKRLNN